MDLKYKTCIIYIADLENKNPLDIIPDFLSNDMQIILKENLFFIEIIEHISPKEWLGKEWFVASEDMSLEDYDLLAYHIDFIKPPKANHIYMGYIGKTSFSLGYDEDTSNKDYLYKDYLFFVLFYNFLKKMLLLGDVDVECFENASYYCSPIKTETDIALFLDGNTSFSELYGFEKNSDMIKYLVVPYTDAIKIKGFPKEWLI